MKNFNPTFSAHFLSVLEKSALPPEYFRPAASPTKNEADLSKCGGQHKEKDDRSCVPISMPSSLNILSTSCHIPGIGLRYWSL